MIFALAHATLGWALAALAAFALRGRTADARCWAWRLGLLKGPLALALAVPVVVATRPAPLTPAPSALVSVEAPLDGSYRSYKTYPAYRTYSRPPETPSTPIDPIPAVYLLGLAGAALLRIAAARRTHRPMPRVVGVLRPRIVIPYTLPPTDAAMALAHEEAHVRRRDPLWSLVADLVCLALWFAPPVWLCARAMRLESEVVCDAAALDESGAARRDYARLLLDFAGPAPANALGGPARRLARRIRMLDQRPKPLSRPLVVAFLALGLVAVLPWRAIAQNPTIQADKPPRAFIPIRVEMDRAMRYLLALPGTKARIGWTTAQDAALASRQARYDAVWKPVAEEAERIRRTRSLNDHVSFSMQELRARDRAEAAAGPMPWTTVQAAELKRLALVRFGGALWTDAEISERLGLTQPQRYLVLTTDTQVLNRVTALLPRSTPLPKPVNDLVVWTTAKYFAASPKDRPRYRDQIERLVKKYRKVPVIERETEHRLLTGSKAWAIRADVDRRLVAALTPDQREALRRLTTDSARWSKPLPVVPRTQARPLDRVRGASSVRGSWLRKDRAGLTMSEDFTIEGRKPANMPAPGAGATLVQTIRQADGSAWKIYLEGDKAPFRYSVERVLAPTLKKPSPTIGAKGPRVQTNRQPGDSERTTYR